MSTAIATTDRCDLGAEDRARIDEAAAILLDARGIVIRLSEWVGGRLSGLGRHFADVGPRLLGEQWRERHRSLVEAALRNAYRVATVGLARTGSHRPGRRLSRLLVAATGGASGFVGLPGIAADLPATTCLIMRSIARIAREHGEDLAAADTRQACIEVFAFGGPEMVDEDIDVAFWTIRSGLSHASLSLLIRQVAARFGLMLSQKYLAQAVPLLGAAAGGTLNYVFMDYYQSMARVHFTLRELERRHDPSAVRDCFELAVRLERQRRLDLQHRRPLRSDAGMLDDARPDNGGHAWLGRSSRESSTPVI